MIVREIPEYCQKCYFCTKHEFVYCCIYELKVKNQSNI